jgi:hypothetical protein
VRDPPQRPRHRIGVEQDLGGRGLGGLGQALSFSASRDRVKGRTRGL